MDTDRVRRQMDRWLTCALRCCPSFMTAAAAAAVAGPGQMSSSSLHILRNTRQPPPTPLTNPADPPVPRVIVAGPLTLLCPPPFALRLRTDCWRGRTDWREHARLRALPLAGGEESAHASFSSPPATAPIALPIASVVVAAAVAVAIAVVTSPPLPLSLLPQQHSTTSARNAAAPPSGGCGTMGKCGYDRVITVSFIASLSKAFSARRAWRRSSRRRCV